VHDMMVSTGNGLAAIFNFAGVCFSPVLQILEPCTPHFVACFKSVYWFYEYRSESLTYYYPVDEIA
jgi:hypothetical protein